MIPLLFVVCRDHKLLAVLNLLSDCCLCHLINVSVFLDVAFQIFKTRSQNEGAGVVAQNFSVSHDFDSITAGIRKT